MPAGNSPNWRGVYTAPGNSPKLGEYILCPPVYSPKLGGVYTVPAGNSPKLGEYILCPPVIVLSYRGEYIL